MNEGLKTWLKDLRFRLRYIHGPQLLASSVLVFIAPFFSHYIAVPLFPETGLWIVRIIYAILFIVYLVRYVWVRLEALDIRGSKRVAGVFLPAIFTLISTALVIVHFDRQNERLYVIETISSIKKSDSTEFYQISNYHVLYEEAKFKSGYRYESRTKHHDAVHWVHTYVVCPVILNFMTDYQAETQELWIGFEYSRGVSKKTFTDEDFKRLEKGNMDEFQTKPEITYFKETSEENYLSIIDEQFAPDTDKVEVLHSHFDPYVPYDGYQNVFWAACVQLGVSLFIFLVFLQYDIDQWEQLEVLKKKNWKL